MIIHETNQLTWIQYAHNSLSNAATSMSPSEVSLGYQAPLFPIQEEEIAVPSSFHTPTTSYPQPATLTP